MREKPKFVITHILLYWSLILKTTCVNSSKVKVINMSERTINGSNETSDANETSEKKIVVGLLLPHNFPHPDDLAYFNRLDSVLPGVILATQDLQETLPDWSWDILVGDTDCNSTTGPLQAVDMFYKNRSSLHISSYLKKVLTTNASPSLSTCLNLSY